MPTIINATAGGYLYLERVESESPCNAGFSLDGGKASWDYVLQTGTGEDGAITPDDLTGVITDLLGTTGYTATGDGSLNRNPPQAHPIYPFMYCSQITSIKGAGTFTVQPADPTLEVPPIPQFALYENYNITAEFKPKPYAVLTDNEIQQYEGTWYPETGNGTVTMTYQYADEWNRYLDLASITPQNDNVTLQQGGMTFITTGAIANNVNGATFLGTPKMILPNSIIKFVWYQVPLRFITSPNSTLVGFRGRINQDTWETPWITFARGQLLYLGYNPQIYTPPVPDEVVQPFGNAFSVEKWCNIEVMFLYTTRNSPDAPATSPTGNLNYVTAGHNLQPALQIDRAFHYAETGNSTVGLKNRVPSWFSFPLEALFTDPDSFGNQFGFPLSNT